MAALAFSSTPYPDPATTDAVTRPSASATLSSSVATLRVASALPAPNVTVEPGVPESTAPSSLTLTDTVSAVAVSPVRLRVNVAAAPSVTGDAAAPTEITGSAAATAAVASLTSVSSVPPSSAKLTRTLTVLPTSAAVSV